MTTFQALTLMISFSTMVIALIAAVVAIFNAKNSPPVRQMGKSYFFFTE